MRAALVCAALACAGAAWADEMQVQGLAQGDGSLIALASICKLSRDEIAALAAKQEADTLARARAEGVAMDSAGYREYALAGLRSTAALVSQIQPGTESFESNCRDVREKVRKKMAP